MLLNYNGVQEIMAVRPYKITITDCETKRVVVANPVINSQTANAVKISTNGIQNFLLGNLGNQDVDMILGTAFMQDRIDLSYLEIKEISKASEINDKDIYFGEANKLFPAMYNCFSCDGDVDVVVIDKRTGLENSMSGNMELPMY